MFGVQHNFLPHTFSVNSLTKLHAQVRPPVQKDKVTTGLSHAGRLMLKQGYNSVLYHACFCHTSAGIFLSLLSA